MPNNRLRILHIITGLTVGGAQQLLLETLPELKANGHEVQLIGLYPGPLAKEFVSRGIPVTELSLKGMVDPRTFWRLLAEIRRFSPDIVHTHLGKADNYGRTAAWLAGVKRIVTTVHNVEDWKENRVLRFVDAFTAKLCDRIVACSGRVADHLLSLGNVNSSKVVTIQNGLDLRNWPLPLQEDAGATRRELGFTEKDFVVGTLGRMEVQKGHAFLVEAAAIAREQGCNVKLLFVGDGSLRQTLVDLVAERGLSEHVVFAGVRRDTKALLAAMDLFALPSLWEGLPIALLEAMAANRCIVATPVGGVPEVIENGYSGLLVPPGDAESLAQAIMMCKKDRTLASQLSDGARRSVEESFSLDVGVTKLLNVYQELAYSTQR
ncbi:MAG: glycosyltransferase [Bacillota bacterium]